MKVFKISGFFKDDKSEFDGLLVCEYDSCPEDMDCSEIFHFGMDEYSIISAIEYGQNTSLDFVITGYEIN